MKTKIVQAWEYYPCFEDYLNETIKSLEPDYEIIDIKYSTFYDVIKHEHNYSALIIFKDKGSDKE